MIVRAQAADRVAATNPEEGATTSMGWVAATARRRSPHAPDVRVLRSEATLAQGPTLPSVPGIFPGLASESASGSR